MVTHPALPQPCGGNDRAIIEEYAADGYTEADEPTKATMFKASREAGCIFDGPEARHPRSGCCWAMVHGAGVRAWTCLRCPRLMRTRCSLPCASSLARAWPEWPASLDAAGGRSARGSSCTAKLRLATVAARA
eukprot:scaffold23366_cov112-Isochrysis_galbana.AAC.9